MKCEAKTEHEMRESSAPWPNTLAELSVYIEGLTDREHDYGTSCYAMSLAATAALQYVAKKLNTDGFQAACADLDIIRRTKWRGVSIKCVVDNDELREFQQTGLVKRSQK